MLRAISFFLLVLSISSCLGYRRNGNILDYMEQRPGRYYRSLPFMSKEKKIEAINQLVDFMNDAGRLRFGR